ncbi:acyl-CoA dehydrogenase family protein [Streptomyces sp. XD-27]|uniref:acyl-CoA dehydrogenase family protein n=1 Tax=Streptomyces sp. XD-27 TaxID=3062779 RepID=UPI0026F471B7|nr:acyl-CoA dehydrogenase family protein [Streptomyces sp. XD-27]WKX71462.1 acyl-CoA dehydrogenase family protein [Streptomyces sp. XD-27]
MDFTFTEEQQAAMETARAVFSGTQPDDVPSPALTPGAVADDIDRPLWRKLAAADLLALTLDEQYGGAGLDPIALCLVLREAGHVLARVPLLENSAAALTIQTHGSTELRHAVLPRTGRGELILTTAASGRSGHDPAEQAVQAHHHPNGTWTLDGVQTTVPWAQHADRVLTPARTEAGHTVLALIPRTQDGVTLLEQISTNGEQYAELRLDAVRINHTDVITADGAWERLRHLLTTGTCALALGLATRVLAMTSEYTGKREQFGFPLATFQAVAVQAADRYIDQQAMEATLWQAAWRLTTDHQPPTEPQDPETGVGILPAAADIAVAKIWAAEGVRRTVQTAQHLHGGFGAVTDYPLHRYHAWAKQLELSLGSAAAHEEALGDLLAAHPLT